MVSDAIYQLCLPVLQDPDIADEDKTDKVEDVLRKETKLIGKELEEAVLDILWRHRDSSQSSSTSPRPVRARLIRSASPAPWQRQSASPSPRISSASLATPPAFNRTKSSTASPFSSPRPSPRLAYATPAIPHSPSLSAYQFSESSPTVDNYGDYGSDNVDWLVNDDSAALGTPASEWVQPHNVDMSPYDMLRSILRDDKTDDELEKILESNGYDLSQTLISLVDTHDMHTSQASEEQNRTYLVGKSMNPESRPLTPATNLKTSGVVCKYWLSSGHCARADCRFSHDLSNHLCKYWLMGSCLAGDSCIFSHDPSALVSRLTMSDASPSQQAAQPSFQVQDYQSFPALQPTTSNPYEHSAFDSSLLNSALPPQSNPTSPSTSVLNPFATFVPTGPRSRPSSQHTSRQQSRAATPSALSVNDDEAFPSLGSAAASRSSKRHGKRGHGHAALPQKASPVPGPASLAEVVRTSASSPSPISQARRGVRPTRPYNASREDSAAAMAIPAPEQIPWLETGENANKAYLKARAEAFKHGGLRNKFLQSAAQAWNRNDARGAKALSLRGQNENNLMKEAHREAARCLYEERNKSNGLAKELFVDLHGLHPEEAVSYLTACLLDHATSSRPVYAICGTGHHSKNGKDKVGKAVRAYLNEWRYAFREFSVPGDRNNIGGILGVDPSSYDRDLARKAGADGIASSADSGVGFAGAGEDSKIRALKRDDAAGQASAS
ncbi:hypothetical protein AAFC00_001782 [Neodothiora populina]|uniref:CCCH zinc finger and SMR domain-containing protein n=1 Tax=Neodothiora populina TaxID=2781224 RepID=A0ABR3PQE5_9PEZI